MMAALAIAEFRHLDATIPYAAGMEWDELAERLTTFSERTEKDGPGWSPVIYEDDATRGNDGVIQITAAVIDIDGDDPEWGLLDAFEYVAHTTYSHMSEEKPGPHWRIILPFSEPVLKDDWKDRWRRIQFWLAPAADEACKDESRFYWWPTCQPGRPREAFRHEGTFLNPDTLKPVPETTAPRLTLVDRPVGTPGPTGERPGDRFARENDWADILKGWRLLSDRGGTRKWERPPNGKPKQTPGCSATTGGGGYDVFYVFSSNAAPFRANESYSKFRAYSLLEHGGDDRAAASYLAKLYAKDEPKWTWERPVSAPQSEEGAADPEQPTEEPKFRLQALTAQDLFLGEPTPVPWLLHAPPNAEGEIPGGLLSEGDICIIGAASGTGKTWLGAELTYSLASATPLFDSFTTTRPCRVMIVDEESSTWLLRRRWLKILKGHNIEPEQFVAQYWQNMKVYVDNGFSFDDDRTLEALYLEAMEFKPDVVVFDTLARVHRRPENDNSEIAKLFEDRIKPFKREFGCSLMFMHHVRKASKDAPSDPSALLRGASDLKGQLDQFWFLRARVGESRAIFEHDKCRAMPELPSFVIERKDTENGGVRVTRVNEIGAVGATASEQHQDVILTYLIDTGKADRQQIVDFGKTRGIGRTNVDYALKALIENGHVDRVKLGREVEFFPSEMD